MRIPRMMGSLGRGVGRLALSAFLIGFFFVVFGVTPWEYAVALYVSPPWWVTHPATRWGALLLGLGIMWAAWKYDAGAWPTKRRMRRDFVEHAWPSLDSSAIMLLRDIAQLGFAPSGADDRAWQALERTRLGVRDSSTDRRSLRPELEPFILRKLRKDGYLHSGGASAHPAVVAPERAVAAYQLPYDIDARSALLYAANRTWVPRLAKDSVDSDTAPELQRIFDALKRFYELASHEGGLRVWGRTSMSKPPKLIEPTHWQDWHIDHTTLFAGPDAVPLRTVPRGRLPDKSSPYYDLRLSKAEVERAWPPQGP